MLAQELVTMSAKEVDRLEVIRRVSAPGWVGDVGSAVGRAGGDGGRQQPLETVLQALQRWRQGRGRFHDGHFSPAPGPGV